MLNICNYFNILRFIKYETQHKLLHRTYYAYGK